MHLGHITLNAQASLSNGSNCKIGCLGSVGADSGCVEHWISIHIVFGKTSATLMRRIVVTLTLNKVLGFDFLNRRILKVTLRQHNRRNVPSTALLVLLGPWTADWFVGSKVFRSGIGFGGAVNGKVRHFDILWAERCSLYWIYIVKSLLDSFTFFQRGKSFLLFPCVCFLVRAVNFSGGFHETLWLLLVYSNVGGLSIVSWHDWLSADFHIVVLSFELALSLRKTSLISFARLFQIKRVIGLVFGNQNIIRLFFGQRII